MSIEKEQPATQAAVKFTSCPNWGVGGSYTYDPATKMRTRLQPATEAAASQVKSETPVAPAGKAKNDEKEVSNG